MKKITNLLMLLAVVMLTACDNEIETVPPLKVTPYNLEGAWRLHEWNADTLAENTYVYLVLDSKLTFEMYQNTNSMYTELITGTYKVEEDWRVGDVISGTYDYENGAWNHEYIVTNLYKESMIWTAKDDSTDVQKFVRVDEVPTHVVDEARKPLE